MRKCHLNCLCIFIHRIVHILSILGRQPIACFLITVSDIFTAILLSFCIYLPPSSHFPHFPHWVTCNLGCPSSHPRLAHHLIREEMKALGDSLQADSIASIDGELEQISSESNPNSHQHQNRRTLLGHSAPWHARHRLPWIKSFRQREVRTEAGNELYVSRNQVVFILIILKFT